MSFPNDNDIATSWFLEQLVDADEPTMVERSARQHAMPPLLRRDERELYRVVDGEVTFFVGDEVVRAAPGDVVVAPAGVPRTFRVESEGGARWQVMTRAGSLQQFVDFGRAVSAITAETWPSEDERSALAAMGAPNGIELLGPPGTLPARIPLFV
jgi:hypothetical protein